MRQLWSLPLTAALLISFGLLGFLHASDEKDKKKKAPKNAVSVPSNSVQPNAVQSNSVPSSAGQSNSVQPRGVQSSTGMGVGQSGKPPSAKPPNTKPPGGKPPRQNPGRSSEGHGHGEGVGTHPPGGVFVPPGFGPGFPPGIPVAPGRPGVPSDVPRLPPSRPTVGPPAAPVSQPVAVAGPGQGGGPQVTTPPGYLSRALSRIAVGVRYGVYFQGEGGEAAARLPAHLLSAVSGVQDVAPVPVKPGSGPIPLTPGAVLPLDGPRSADVLFVVDTTGSMGDEIRELQNSLDEIVDDFRGPDLDVQFGLVAFRDQGDEYVTRLFPFTDDVERFRSSLQSLRAKGGGDIPERGDQALFEGMVKLNWRPERTDRARVVILCGDAPPQGAPVTVKHGNFTYQTTTHWLLTTATTNHMQIHSVACSGTNQQGLAWFRGLAEATGGTFEDLASSSLLREELRRRHNLFQHPITSDDLAAAQNSLPRGLRRVAVLPFKNLNNEKSISFLSELLLSGVIGVMKQQPQLAVNSQSAVMSLVRSRDFRDKSLADAPVVQALGKRLGADLLITGLYFNFQDKLHLSGEAIDTGSGETIVKVEQIVESNGNMFDVPLGLARELLVKAGIAMEPVDSASAQPAAQRSLTATMYFQKAQELADQSMRYHARESLASPLKEKALSFVERAIEHDAEFLDAYLLRVGLLESLNRADEVAHTLTTALERAKSSQIPSDDPARLALEARHSYVVGHDFGVAVRLYAQILDKQPTNKHALWQLANITSGEWGCPPEHRNLAMAKQCVAKILTLYPTSGMARYLEDAATTLVAEPSPATT